MTDRVTGMVREACVVIVAPGSGLLGRGRELRQEIGQEAITVSRRQRRNLR